MFGRSRCELNGCFLFFPFDSGAAFFKRDPFSFARCAIVQQRGACVQILMHLDKRIHRLDQKGMRDEETS